MSALHDAYFSFIPPTGSALLVLSSGAIGTLGAFAGRPGEGTTLFVALLVITIHDDCLIGIDDLKKWSRSLEESW
jgi:hypothetical protein